MAFFRATQFLVYGTARFGKSGYEGRSDKRPLDQFDLREKVALVTGGNAGIGFEVCKQLLRQGAHVIVCARRNDEGAMRELHDIGPCTLMLCDVSSRSAVSSCIEQVTRLDILVLNAGVMLAERQEADSIEKTLATNVVSNVAFIDGFQPLLEASSDGRVILVSSGGGITERLCSTMEEYTSGNYDGTVAYARTKRMQIALAHYYARRNPRVFFASMHPGWSDTPGVRVAMPGFFNMFSARFRSSAEGADTICWLASVQPRPDQNGGFWRDRAIETEHFTFGGTSYPESKEDDLYAFLKGIVEVN